MALLKVQTWLHEFKETNCLLLVLISYFCSALDAILITDHQLLLRILQLIYDIAIAQHEQNIIKQCI